MSHIITYKNNYKSYAIVPAFAKGGRTCRLLFFTANRNKDLESWKNGLEKLNKPYVFHNELKFEKEEREKFWNDWQLVWDVPGLTPGQSRYYLYQNKYDKNSFLYFIYDTEVYGFHTDPGRYNEWYEFKKPDDEIEWYEGTKRDYEKKKEFIKNLKLSEYLF